MRETEEICKEIEHLQQKYDKFNIYKKIWETSRNYKGKQQVD